MLPLKTNNENVIVQYKAIIQAILREITVKDISIADFCNDMFIDMDEFLDSLNEIKSDFSYYLKVLEFLKDY